MAAAAAAAAEAAAAAWAAAPGLTATFYAAWWHYSLPAAAHSSRWELTYAVGLGLTYAPCTLCFRALCCALPPLVPAFSLLLFATVTSSQVCLLALGHCHPDHWPALLDELPTAFEDAAKVRTSAACFTFYSSETRRTFRKHWFRIARKCVRVRGTQRYLWLAVSDELPMAFAVACGVLAFLQSSPPMKQRITRDRVDEHNIR